MPTIREVAEDLEDRLLSPLAARSRSSRGRERPEEECPVRTAFQRDRDRIVHSKAFRRLKGKTQVFLSPRGDHYRTRLTHSLEVSQVGRTIARALRLNEDLVEAIALGHDLGHTPFGHAGEAALDMVVPGGFRHNEQGLRVVTVVEGPGRGGLEPEGPEGWLGLNLTWEVRDGILCHVPEREPSTLEGQIVQLADRVAYINHDIDDAVRAGVLDPVSLPPDVPEVLGRTGSQRIGAMVMNIIENSLGRDQVRFGGKVAAVTADLHDFMFERVYLRAQARAEHERVKRMIGDLYRFYAANPDVLAAEYERAAAPWPGPAASPPRSTGPSPDPAASPPRSTGPSPGPAEPAPDTTTPIERLAADYVAGMTDRFAIDRYTDHFIPHTWEE